MVRPEWIDCHGHMRIGHYAYLFEEAARALFRCLDLSQDYRERTDHAYFALEQHVTFDSEVFAHDGLQFVSQFVDWTPKRAICLHVMHNTTRNTRAACSEVIYAHIDLTHHRSVPLPADQQARLQPVIDAHLRLPLPLQPGRSIAPIASG